MKIAISGASGFIGSHLSEYFIAWGYEILPLGRVFFTNEESHSLLEAVGQSDVVINLAGAPINHRWTAAYKKKIYSSRIGVTRRLVEAVNASASKPKVFISASAAGYYSSEGCHDESDPPGTGFLSELCVNWEAEAGKVSDEVRLVITRFGVVLAPKGGAFEKMAFPAKLGMATVIGPGTQPFSWIDINDLSRAMESFIQLPGISGPVNMVAPQQLSNREFTRQVARHYHSLLTLKPPQFSFHLLFGESSKFMTEGQCVVPAKLKKLGFVFETPTLAQFLNNLGRPADRFAK